jgi:hypothetical protein
MLLSLRSSNYSLRYCLHATMALNCVTNVRERPKVVHYPSISSNVNRNEDHSKNMDLDININMHSCLDQCIEILHRNVKATFTTYSDSLRPLLFGNKTPTFRCAILGKVDVARGIP